MEYLKIWTSFRETISPLNDAEKGRLFDAMLLYAETGEQPDFKGNERYIWPTAKQAIDRAAQKVDTLRRNGTKGGRPPKPNETKENQEKPNETKENQTKAYNDKDKEKEKIEIKENPLKGGKEKTLTRFSPPSVDEVAIYCRERGNRINAQQFVDFYAAKGWKIGQNTMKDWKAAVRTWEQRDEQKQGQQQTAPAKVVTAQQYGQREYHPGELDAIGDDLIAEARRQRSSA